MGRKGGVVKTNKGERGGLSKEGISSAFSRGTKKRMVIHCGLELEKIMPPQEVA